MSDPSVETAAYPPPYNYTVPPWPPPSGGAPVSTPETGPVANPSYAGQTQTPTVPISPPLVPGYPPPFGSQKGTTYPQKMPVGHNGQNQGASNALPVSTKPWETGPQAANPFYSQISPPPIMGPGPQGAQPYEQGPLAGNPAPGRSFPAGSYLDGFSS